MEKMGVWYSVENENQLLDGFSNTRPERTNRPGLRVLVDWVSCTFSMTADFDDVKAVLGLSELEMEYRDYGLNTFQEQMVFSNIKIQRKNEYTYQLFLTGQGCREFEKLSTYTWLEVIAILKDFTDCKFTRLDLAIDDFAEHYKVERIRSYLEKRLVVTRLEEYEDKRRKKIATGELVMDSIYLGSIDSRLSINVYDKRLERDNVADQESDGSWDSWTRTELRLKREYADQTADMILEHQMDLGLVAFGILKKNIRFIKSRGDKNKRRRDEAIWWLNFIGKVEKLKFSLLSPDRTIEKSKKWFGHAVAPVFSAIQDSDPEAFEEWLLEMLEQGRERRNEKHDMMVKQSQELKIQQIRNNIKNVADDQSSLHQRIYKNNLKNENDYRNRKNQTQRTPD